MKVLAFALILAAGAMPALQILAEEAPTPWRIIIANDTCPDVTWGFSETQVRPAFADLIAAHLDEMTRTDVLPLEDRDHYNATAFIEVEAFLQIYPQRQGELLRRIHEGRLCVSPFLCNSLWGFQSVEGALRTFYPARRMEREHGMPIGVAEHIELPSLPWGMASLMAGCGIRWTSVPFLDYDPTFKGLKNPPLFRLEGPDGSEVRVLLDTWASQKANYMQGGYLLKDPQRVASEWIPHYAGLGGAYPLRTIFASGTHSDINPNSYKQARSFADSIIAQFRVQAQKITSASPTACGRGVFLSLACRCLKNPSPAPTAGTCPTRCPSASPCDSLSNTAGECLLLRAIIIIIVLRTGTRPNRIPRFPSCPPRRSGGIGPSRCQKHTIEAKKICPAQHVQILPLQRHSGKDRDSPACSVG